MVKTKTVKKEVKDKAKEGKISKKELNSEIKTIEKKIDVIEKSEIKINASRPIAQIIKGDKAKVDGKEYVVDAHYVLIDHGSTKEMAIELFDPKTDKDYQIRYFDDQAEKTIEFYELQEIIYVRKQVAKIEW